MDQLPAKGESHTHSAEDKVHQGQAAIKNSTITDVNSAVVDNLAFSVKARIEEALKHLSNFESEAERLHRTGAGAETDPLPPRRTRGRGLPPTSHAPSPWGRAKPERHPSPLKAKGPPPPRKEGENAPPSDSRHRRRARQVVVPTLTVPVA